MNEERPSCERHEILISTWMDDGLERGDQRELFDHIVRCPECRGFYADARALEGLAAIAGSAEPPLPSAQGRPAWAWRAAAALLLSAALAFVAWPSSRPANRPFRQMEVVLEEDRGDMTESRFLELATEILRADRRYHFAMREVMEKVIDEEWESEGASSEGLSEEPANDQDENEGPPFRV